MHPPLSDDERLRYEWQLWMSGFGEVGQQKLKASTVFVSRVGGVGGAVAYQLAAAGVGRLILAHAGDARPSDLNRQLLLDSPSLAKPRVETAARRLAELNPYVEVIAHNTNVSEENVRRLAEGADVVVSCPPRFEERLAMNAAAVALRIPLVDCAMYEFDVQLTTVLPGVSACLACLYPAEPPQWRREFPVFGAVAGTIGSLAAVEVIKLLAALGEPLMGRMLVGDLGAMQFRTVRTLRNPACAVCAGVRK